MLTLRGVSGYAPLLIAALLLSALLILYLSGYRLTYREAIDAGRALPVVEGWDRLHASSVHYISYFNREFGTRQWNSAAPLHQRYILEMKIDPFHVTKRAGRVEVVHHGPPRFELYAVELINIRPGGSIQMGRTVVRRFGIVEWERLVEANGDWSVIGVELRTDDPLDGFDLLWERLK